MDISKTEYLFVYGTLMQKYARNPFSYVLQKSASFVGDAFTSGNLYLIDYYPGFIPANSLDFVYGEVFEIKHPTELFTSLDEYESYFPDDTHNSQYIREKITVYFSVHNEPITAWAYVYNEPVALHRRIESGNFIEYISKLDQK